MLRHIFNTVTTAFLAIAIATRLGLPAPQIAMVCVFIVMQPQARQVFAKGYHRMLGTIGGALAAWAMAAMAPQSPAHFLAAVGVWVALFTAIAAFHSQLTAYSLLLTGYTPILIAIPMALNASHIATSAASRLAEVALGIVCASAVAYASSRWPGKGAPQASAPAVRPASPALPTKAASASLAGLHPAIAMAAMGTLWLATSWRGGPMATLNATVNCALVALAAQPVRASLQMTWGTLLAVAAGLALQLSYPHLPLSPYLLYAPALALGAWMTGRPESLAQGLGYSITLCMLGYPGGSLVGGNGGGAQYLYDAAGLSLSVLVQTAVCALLRPLRLPPPAPSR
ncbi:FUSC family protein [Pseudoduganella aquatica]|uniref:FUSC family protein n=1 Tax=Pseudoduganella aquatica TaxID=2660641 RepID=UPI001E43D13D|nr:FUSC family protein [Pseudoduganella aquatica]